MKKQLILLSLVSSVLLADTFINPLPASVRSIDNGGVKQAIDAYKDGVGAEIVDNIGVATNNSSMNTLVYKYGDSAKTSGITVVNQVMATGTAADKIIASSLTSVNIDGTSCSDGNAATVGETWLNNVCQGGVVGTIASNGLIYDNCEAGSINGSLNYIDSVSYCSSKGMRLPTLAETIAGGGTIPSCLGWTWTSTPYNLTQNHNWYNNISMFYPTIDLKNVRCIK
jgi:hypothetical protein